MGVAGYLAPIAGPPLRGSVFHLPHFWYERREITFGRARPGERGHVFDLFTWDDLDDAYAHEEEYVVVRSKLRPCIVLSSDAEIRAGCPRIVVVPVLSYNSATLESEVLNDERPYYWHVEGAPTRDLHRGYADFTQAVGMPKFFFGRPRMTMKCRMDDATLIEFFEAYAAWVDPPQPPED